MLFANEPMNWPSAVALAAIILSVAAVAVVALICGRDKS